MVARDRWPDQKENAGSSSRQQDALSLTRAPSASNAAPGQVADAIVPCPTNCRPGDFVEGSGDEDAAKNQDCSVHHSQFRGHVLSPPDELLHGPQAEM